MRGDLCSVGEGVFTGPASTGCATHGDTRPVAGDATGAHVPTKSTVAAQHAGLGLGGAVSGREARYGPHISGTDHPSLAELSGCLGRGVVLKMADDDTVPPSMRSTCDGGPEATGSARDGHRTARTHSCLLSPGNRGVDQRGNGQPQQRPAEDLGQRVIA
ncbi:hypothetical protein GCM10010361_29170 [Streptomyces olivaceiscleroticus]|uniref:Uncharacterized protein n=1 Tax=Streptomyces olivaceiscleroticus TaxID=68245 RepID=A0ABP3JST4_9ACTN